MRCGSCSIFNLRRAVQRRALHARDAAWKRCAVCEESEDHGLRSAACRERWVVEEMHCVAFVFFSHIKNGEAEGSTQKTRPLRCYGNLGILTHTYQNQHIALWILVSTMRNTLMTPQKSAPTEEPKKARFCGGAPSGSSDSKPHLGHPIPIRQNREGARVSRQKEEMATVKQAS